MLFALLPAAEKPAAAAGSVVKREGKPDCVQVSKDNKEMAQAVQEAPRTVDKFTAALRAPKASQTRFAVKKPFIEGDKVEHLWVNELRFDGGNFRGKVDNEPIDLEGVHLGDEVSVAPEEISDWMFVEDGRLVGGYTVRCMSQALSPAEKERFEEATHCRID